MPYTVTHLEGAMKYKPDQSDDLKFWTRHFKRKQQKRDEVVLEKILDELKEKHEQQKQQQIAELKEQLRQLGVEV